MFDTIMFNASSGSSARRGSKPSKSMCSDMAQIRRATTLGVLICRMHRYVRKEKANSIGGKRLQNIKECRKFSLNFKSG